MHGHLACFDVTMNDERSNICFPNNKDGVSFREGLMYFSRTMKNHKLHVLQQNGFAVEWVLGAEWPECLVPHLSPIAKILRIIKYTSKTTTNSGPNSNTKRPATHTLNAQTSSKCFKKKRCCTTANIKP